MFRWNKVLYLLLKTAPYRAFALNLCPLSTNEPVSGASKEPNLPGESILAMETPGCGVAGIVPAQSLMKNAVNRITYRNHSRLTDWSQYPLMMMGILLCGCLFIALILISSNTLL